MKYVPEHDAGPQCRSHVENQEGRMCFLQDGTPRLMVARSALLGPLSFMPEQDWEILQELLSRIAVAVERLNRNLEHTPSLQRGQAAQEPGITDAYGPSG